jgi:hypothetical protein
MSRPTVPDCWSQLRPAPAVGWPEPQQGWQMTCRLPKHPLRHLQPCSHRQQQQPGQAQEGKNF